MQLPTGATVPWLSLLFITAWPGLLSLVVYRVRVPGPALAWKDSFAIAAFFTAVNYIVFMPATIVVVRGAGASSRLAYWSAVATVLLIGPAILPLVWSRLRNTAWMNRVFVAQYATAWDFYFIRRRPALALIHLKDGSLVAGYWGPGAYASLSPNAGDLYLTEVYKVDLDGRVGPRVPHSDGVLVRRGEYTHIELFKTSAAEGT